MYENKQEEQTAVLAAIDTGEYDAQRSMDELEELAKSAGAKVMGRVIQKKDRPDPATLMGSGRVEELAEFVQNSQVELVIFDHELSPAQQKNLENALGAAVIDRTTLILDIFAQRAKTSEGRLQVELAQLKYRLPRPPFRGRGKGRITSLLAGRRHRHPRSRRKQAGKRPPTHPPQDTRAGRGAGGIGKTPRLAAPAQEKGRRGDGCHRGLHQRGQIHPAQHPDRCGRAGKGYAVCDAGPDLPRARPAGRAQGDAD